MGAFGDACRPEEGRNRIEGITNFEVDLGAALPWPGWPSRTYGRPFNRVGASQAMLGMHGAFPSAEPFHVLLLAPLEFLPDRPRDAGTLFDFDKAVFGVQASEAACIQVVWCLDVADARSASA